MNIYFGMIGNKLSETLPDSDRPPRSRQCSPAM